MLNDFYKCIPTPRPYHKHRLIKHLLSFGHIQFDVKVIGSRDNKFGVNIYCVDMVDEISGMVFGRASLRYPKEFILQTLKDAYAYYSLYFVILRMRTDRSSTFKRTEAMNTGKFNDLLTSLNIIHQYSFWNQPETNGKIENLHRQIDKELLEHINQCDTIEQAIELINRWYDAYNTKRTKGYKF
jgi:transposase InsO family protein